MFRVFKTIELDQAVFVKFLLHFTINIMATLFSVLGELIYY